MFLEQEEILEQFQNISNCQIPVSEQIALLESVNWNLELALIQYWQLYPRRANFERRDVNMATDSSSNSASNSASNQRSWFSSLFQNSEETYVPLMPGSFPITEERQPSKLHRIVNTTFKWLLDQLVLFVVVPLYVLLRILGLALLVVIGGIVPIIMKLHPSRYHVIRKNADPADMARRFIVDFDDLIGNVSRGDADEDETGDLINQADMMEIQRPDFLECSYSHALHFAKKDARWLLLYIHSENHQDTKNFIQDVLISPEFLQFIREKQILIWGGDIKDSEAYQVANQFKVTRLPFLGMLCLTVNETPTASGVQQSDPILSMVCKIQGYMPSAQVLSKLQKNYNKFNPKLESIRADVQRLHNDRQTRQLQDQAYENSLRRDRMRRMEEALLQRERQEQTRAATLREKWLKWRKSTLLPDPEPAIAARIAIRLPDGKRVRHNFDKNAKIEEIYAFVECTYLNNVEISDSDTLERPIGYNHQYKFDVYTVYPREKVVVDDELSIADSQQVYPDGNLVVELNSEN
ncbi:hypothetical protein KL918_004888 [Ogataea parapolymorpha]|uniref:UBX domain-containing protein 3 n=1 Tax=Ogataea parapolymorpha (strain ATCC 26012 / BCRC 20466 / JCM 22074 / NRRL Y-7560 / DL-1) TaxID=871575 RepID=W1QI42_OGAPD|nr:UBX domain-containing protein 3 [Ogataea parapolymorpha DL-1]ESX00104.1 UBX domain-containing protein 3 [Ogataea parapolymorpha DL-1]KAG7865012.1 hypothetical protein KL918_004888 [Ogataea parapolymorpha]KAG7872305.1 hypothetical protein KL916_003328 [Ogataea parapolymorpha]